MSRLVARIVSSALLAMPVVAHAGDGTQSAPSTVGPATRGPAAAPAADQEFLEYLGWWDDSDEDWVVASEPVRKKKPRARGVEKGGPAAAPATTPDAGEMNTNGNGEQAGTGQEQDK
jgi:hypothetical protein